MSVIKNAVCNNVNSNQNTVAVQFAVIADKQTREPGKTLARTVVSCNFSDINEGKNFVPGKFYDITIAESVKPFAKGK